MALSQQMIEGIGRWCLDSMELAPERKEARRLFFGDDDARPVNYWPGANEGVFRERRFLGWFVFDFALPDGQRPAEVAIKRLYQGQLQFELLKAVSGTRFVLAVVSTKIRRSVYLELEDETFEARSSVWAATVRAGEAIVAHLVPERRGYWLPGPGWFVWPIGLGPGIRSSLKQFQLDPISVERFLQMRSEPEGSKPRREVPRDNTMLEAVARMTNWATEKGHAGLVMPVDDWQSLVLKYMGQLEVNKFAEEAIAKLGNPGSEEELQEVMDLAMNVWNNTPQSDRGGRSANQLLRR